MRSSLGIGQSLIYHLWILIHRYFNATVTICHGGTPVTRVCLMRQKIRTHFHLSQVGHYK